MKVCMLAYTFYELDSRVRMYAETLSQRGDQVDVIALRTEGKPYHEFLNGVNVYRIQKRKFDEKSRFSYMYRLMKFLLKSTWTLSKKYMQNQYDLIHVHSVPDFEVFAAWWTKLLGAKIILDIHDIVPEFYVSKFNGRNNSLVFKGLVYLEKLSTGFADHVIISNHIWKEKIVRRSVKEEKCTVILNCPNPCIFQRRPRTSRDSKFMMVYPGTLNWHQGVDIAIKAFSIINNQVGEVEFNIYGEGPLKNKLATLISELGLKERVLLRGLQPLERIADIIAESDLGIVPKRNDSFGGEAFSTKILEFMALGVPVIVSETKIDRYYFNDSVVHFFKPEDEKDLARSMLLLIKDKGLREHLAENALKFVADYTWDKRKSEYLDLVDRLVNS